MAITDALVLPADVVLVPVAELPEPVRATTACEEGDYAITRPRSRTPSKIIDSHAAELLKEFRTARTIVEAVIRYSQANQTDAEQTLEEAFPLIQRFLGSRLLVPADSDEARGIVSSLEMGDRVAEFEILRCPQVLEDTELYQVKPAGGETAVLKIARPGFGAGVQHAFDREAAILTHLDGSVNPALLEAGTFEERPYLALEWCPGVHASVAADELRQNFSAPGRIALLEFCASILEAYSRLHAQNVIHSDVHPRNVLAASDGSVSIIDYGLARLDRARGKLGKPERGGVGYFFEPEYARARLAHRAPPRSTPQGEQYSLAAMLYLFLTGAHYLDFSVEKKAMLGQIAEGGPLPFTARGAPPWPEVEELLGKALSKEPSERFRSVAELANGLRDAAARGAPSSSMVAGIAIEGNGRTAQALLADLLAQIGPAGPLLSAGLPTAPTCSVNYGAAGIAYALYRITCMRGDSELLSLADLWATKAASAMASSDAFYSKEIEITPETVGRISPYHTASGVHCVQALIAHAMGDVVSHQAAVDAFITTSDGPCENLDLTLGRSSTLLACSLLLDSMPESKLLDSGSLRELGERVMRSIWDAISAYAPIAECRELAYLGIAHGWAGVLYAVMRWCQSSGTPLPHGIAERLHQLAECAEPVGRGARWKISRRGRGSMGEYMSGWCNGSAGHVYLWTLAHRMLRDPAYLALAERAAWNTWEEPAGIASLCCGLAGRAYGLLNLYRHTGSQEWLLRAQALGHRAAAFAPAAPPVGMSLYKGDVGVAVLATDLSRPEAACMPFFEQEGWPARQGGAGAAVK